MGETLRGCGVNDALGWPARFKAQHGRAPRVLHVCNIANYAYTNAMMMRRHGVDAVVLDPDFFHVASTPEWLEAEIAGDHGDDFYPDWPAAGVKDYQRPEWFINGPTPLVFPELAARESGDRFRRWRFRTLSAIYRRGLGAPKDKISAFRRFMEGKDPASRLLKAVVRAVTVRDRTPAPAAVADAGDFSAAAALPRRVPIETMRQALEPFDIVLGYTLGARHAAALGLPRIVSMELGTLRGLPFEDSELGRLCAWLYRASPYVFLTNVDAFAATERLGLDPQRLVAMPHPFDVETAVAFAAAPPVSPFAGPAPYFFCPARHHWQQGNASWLKGNDVLIAGAALAAARGLQFRLVFVDWGEDVGESRKMIERLGLASRVHWVRPLPRRSLWPVVCGAVAVLDQFSAPAFGGVGLESMALGKRVVSKLAGGDPTPFFKNEPPFLAAANAEDVAAAIAQILDDVPDRAGLGAAGQKWMMTEHGASRQMAQQFAVFEDLVAAHGPALNPGQNAVPM